MTWKIRETGTGDNLLYSQAGTPSLDLRFATEKSLDDYVSASNLITFTRASIGTYVDNGHISRLTYWPTRLSDATLQTITAP